MDLDKLMKPPASVTVGGREYKIGPLRFLHWGIIQRHLDSTIARPDDAGPGWKPPQVMSGTDWISSLFSTEAGTFTFLSVLFGVHQELTDDDLLNLTSNIGVPHIQTLLRVAMDLPEDDRPASVAPAA